MTRGMKNLRKIFSISKKIVMHPQSLSLLLDREKERKEYLQKAYGYIQLKTINILDLLPGLNETVNHYSFLSQTSLITDIVLLKTLARRFDEWIKQNEAKIEAKKSNLEKSQDDELGKRLTVEKRVNEARAAKLAKRNADLAAKVAAGDKALVEAVNEEVSPAEETTEEIAPEETSSEPAADDKPQE